MGRFDPPDHPIPAITLYQPWASLWAWGVKRYETRHWKPRTNYTGPMAIHAGKSTEYLEPFLLEVEMGFLAPGISELARYACVEIELGFDGITNLRDLFPTGVVIGMGEVVAYHRVETLWGKLFKSEKAFGNYDPGRWAWEMKDARLFKEAIPARGEQSIWRWDPHWKDLPQTQLRVPKEKTVTEAAQKPVKQEPTHQQLRLF